MNCVEDEAALRLPRSGQLYRHYKGGLYRIEGRYTLEADLSEGVLYRSLNPAEAKRQWARPLTDFQAEIAPGIVRFAPLREVGIRPLRQYLPYGVIRDEVLEQILSNYDQPWRVLHSRDYVLSLFWYASHHKVALSIEQSLALLFGHVVYVPGASPDHNAELSALAYMGCARLLQDTSEVDPLTLLELLRGARPSSRPTLASKQTLQDIRRCYLADDWIHFDAAVEMLYIEKMHGCSNSSAERRQFRKSLANKLGGLLHEGPLFSANLARLEQRARANILRLGDENAT